MQKALVSNGSHISNWHKDFMYPVSEGMASRKTEMIVLS